MIIEVNVKPGSKVRDLQVDETTGTYTVRTPKPPEDGKANKDVVDILAKHFRVPKSAIVLVRGATSKHKIIKIMAL